MIEKPYPNIFEEINQYSCQNNGTLVNLMNIEFDEYCETGGYHTPLDMIHNQTFPSDGGTKLMDELSKYTSTTNHNLTTIFEGFPVWASWVFLVPILICSLQKTKSK